TASGTTLSLACNPSAAEIEAALGTASANDSCSTPAVTSVDSAVTSSGCGRSQTRTFTAKDACNNSSTASRTVTWTVDTTKPVLSGCPIATINLGCNPTPPTCATVSALGITASDICSGSITPVCTPDAVQNVGTCGKSQTFTLTATDACNNSSICTVTYAWTEDHDAPVITSVPSPIAYGCNPATKRGDSDVATLV